MHQSNYELIIDNFAGGGGTSTGIEMAIGRPVDIAINHDPVAIAMHKTNHPETKHFCESVWDVNPLEATNGLPVGLAWFSPDCKHFSKAKGGAPVKKSIRGLAWIVLKWAGKVRPRVIILENVEEFIGWGPVRKGKPVKSKKGQTFAKWKSQLQALGYKVEHRELRACDYGAPTIRNRFFLIARRDGRSIVWPKPTHGDPKSEAVRSGKLLPWKTAAEVIDWSIPCPSIFDRKKPLAENTMRRIARGIQKFVIDNPEPFIIKVNHSGDDFRGQRIDEPLQTITAKNGWGVVAPVIARQFGESVGHSVKHPLGTITASGMGKSQLVTACLAKHYGGNYVGPGTGLNEPVHTVTTRDHNALVAAFLSKYHGEKSSTEVRGQLVNEPIKTLDTSNRFACVTSHLIKMYGTNTGSSITEPVPTVTAGGLHIGEVRAFLMKYYGTNTGQNISNPLQTITTKDRFGLVTVWGEQYQIVDIGMRMLKPRELFNAQGFPDDYIIDHDDHGNQFSQADQVAKCGNAVPPVFAKRLVRANLPELCDKLNRREERQAI